MSEITNLKIPYEEFKSLVIEAIKSHGESFQFVNLQITIAQLAIKKELVQNPFPPNHFGGTPWLTNKDKNRVREVLWDLITERVLTIGDYSNDSWPFLSLTDYGLRAIEAEQPVPNDVTGYLSRLRREIPDIDETIEIYLSESVRTYNINQLLSATITLGCASEKALLILIETYADTYENVDKKQKFIKKTSGKFIKKQFDEFNKEIQALKGDLPFSIKDGYDNTLIGVFQMIRNNRNGAGHPTGKKVDKYTLFANLQVFITYCRFIYDMKEFFEKNKH
ncbi:hypothetical protein [Carboxylicivirga sp. RSCT41]|uniref:hypothetical protein n=1 Tax=Carboxylicivirga agarovorans TaxID=3417570 RepID=UPI003D3513B4